MNNPTRSPIRNLPIRTPGQTLRERITCVADERFLPILVLCVMTIVLAMLEWIAVWTNSPRHPWLLSTAALGSMAVLIWKFRTLRSEIKGLRLGQIGEEAVGQYLDEKMRPLGYHVLHDIPSDSFNVDHAVIGPTGIFAIETKTRSKPQRGQCIVTYDGHAVCLNGQAADAHPIVQAKAEAKWLSDLLEESTGRRFFVQPVVLFPGWYINQTVPAPEVWVLNEKAAPAYIQKSRPTFSPEDVSLILFHLKRYIISQGK